MKVKKLVGVEQQVAQVDPEVADHGGDQVAFDGLGWRLGRRGPCCPRALAGQLGGLEGEPVQDGALEPGGKGGLGAGVEAAVPRTATSR